MRRNNVSSSVDIEAKLEKMDRATLWWVLTAAIQAYLADFRRETVAHSLN